MIAASGGPDRASLRDEELDKLSDEHLSDLDSEVLFALFQRGYFRAVYGLLVKFRRDVFRAALYFVNRYGLVNPDLAADIAQETILRVLHKIDLFDPAKASFKTWMIAICRNETINTIRQAWHRGEIGCDEVDKDGESVFESMLGNESSQESMAIANSYRKEIQDCLNALPDHYKAVWLFYVDGCSFAAMAAALSIDEPTARNRFNRAKPKLRDCLQGKGITTVIDLGSE